MISPAPPSPVPRSSAYAPGEVYDSYAASASATATATPASSHSAYSRRASSHSARSHAHLPGEANPHAHTHYHLVEPPLVTPPDPAPSLRAQQATPTALGLDLGEPLEYGVDLPRRSFEFPPRGHGVDIAFPKLEYAPENAYAHEVEGVEGDVAAVASPRSFGAVTSPPRRSHHSYTLDSVEPLAFPVPTVNGMTSPGYAPPPSPGYASRLPPAPAPAPPSPGYGHRTPLAPAPMPPSPPRYPPQQITTQPSATARMDVRASQHSASGQFRAQADTPAGQVKVRGCFCCLR
ncbi:hypothetical protein Q8F55_000756 [Vanrija albida]|uniref:Uncharacterized protein n=1 Tax=Vanrija albida TaxID=181172 RepID=A0ABR3QEC1_9TREE